MPVVRNPQFYFKEGFCWSAINGTRSSNDLKFRFKQKSVTDVQGMSLHSVINNISSKFIVCIANSDFMNLYTEAFINSTVIFQINDARQIPIIVPSKEELQNFENLFNSAVDIKKKQLSNSISEKKAETQLAEIQDKLDVMVNTLYGI